MKHLIFAMLLLTSAGVHAIGGAHASGGGHASSSAHVSSSAHATSTPHIFSVGHPMHAKPLPVTRLYYSSYGHPPLFINFPVYDNDDCRPPKKCELRDLR